MTERELTRAQGFALIFEAHATRQLLGHGCHLLADTNRFEGLFDPLATVWSIGVEKLLKLAIGLMAIAAGEPWPSGRSFGHDLIGMDHALRLHLHTWSKTQGPWIRGLVDDVENDDVWRQVMPVLDTYARSGRFAYLDRLAEDPSPPPEPRPMWEQVEQAVLQARPELRASLAAVPPAPIAEFNDGLRRMNAEVATSVASWWYTVSRVAAFGAYGVQGKRFMGETEPGMALPLLPPELLIRVK